MKYVLAILLLFASTAADSCSCFRISSIAESIAYQPNLVEGEVIALDQFDSPEFGKRALSATLRVTNVLKGKVDASEITVVGSMCAASLTPDDMQLRHRYVLPLAEPAGELLTMDGATAVVVGGPEPGQYEMAGCAHSGLERVGDSLYTFEETAGRERRLESYMPYPVFNVWWRVASVGFASLKFTFVTLDEKYGISSLMLALLFGGGGIYFAARYSPWLLVLVVPFAVAFSALTLLKLMLDPFERGPHLWVLSWFTPLLIIGGWVAGHKTRVRRQSSSPINSKRMP